MGNEIALYQRVNDPLAACQQWGVAFCASGMFGFTKPEQGYVAALVMLTEGLTPFQFKKKYHVTTGGNIIPKAHHILAEFLAAGGVHKWLKDGEDGMAARIRLEMKGREPVEYEYTIDMAKKAKLVRADSVWEKDPGKMLRARCESSAVAMIAPEILTGLEDEGDSAPIQTTITASAPLFPDAPKTASTAVVEAEVISTATSPVQVESKTVEPANAAPQPARTGSEINPTREAKVEVGPDGRVTTETIRAFVALVDAKGQTFAVQAMKWLSDRQYVQPDTQGNYHFPGCLATMPPARYQAIFGSFDEWCGVVERSAAK